MTTSPTLTPEFLAHVLGRPVDTVLAHRIGTDRGFAGTVSRVTVDADGLAPMTVVAKLGPDPTLDREAEFYRMLAIRLDAPAPRCWYAGPGPSGEPMILLEDLGPARPGDALAGASVEDVAAVLAGMGPVWQHPTTAPGLEVLPRWGGADPVARQERFRGNWAAQRDRLAAELSPEIWQLGERLCNSLAMVVSDLQASPVSVLHADLHLDNVAFRSAGRAIGPVVLDWGSLCAGARAVDVFAFVAMSLSPEDHFDRAADLVSEAGLGSADLDDGRRRLLCYFAGSVGWRNRPAGGHARERELCAAALGDGRLVNALAQWDVARVL